MGYQIDVWAGDLHCEHVKSLEFTDWKSAAEFMEAQVEGGMLCNVLHTDFKAPAGRSEEAEATMIATLNK